MTILYRVELLRPKSGFGKGSVHSVAPVGINFHVVDGTPVYPDMLAVKEAIPHNYRKALERAGQPWFDKTDAVAPATITLRDTTGTYMNTVVLTPYVL